MTHKNLSKALFGVVLAVALGCLPGCGSDGGTTDHGDGGATDSGAASQELVGTWTGHEVGTTSPTWTFTFTATTADVTTSGTEAYQGTYTVDTTATPKRATIVITQSAFPAYVGKTSNGIYKIEGTTLTFAGNEPGNAAVPTSFTPNGVTRVFTLTKQ
jgi:uncharacterized protein (TIGR03067 family)